MKSAVQPDPGRRPYRQTARAATAEATRKRVVEAFRRRLEDQWFEDIRLDDVAQDAKVTVQTVIRHFGGKEGLLEATVELVAETVMVTRQVPVGDPRAAVRGVVDDYENVGDLIMRMLSQEDRYPVIRRFTDVGRASHRAWVAEVFAGALAGLAPADAERRLDALVVATDLYVWKLVRRDMRRPVEELQSLMERMVDAALRV